MARTPASRDGSSWSGGTRYGMCAALIFCFDRVSRLLIAASSTRKARAISAIVSPPSSRRVSATWASRASAGWQHVKISRSRSSGTVLTVSGSTGSSSKGPSMAAACACRASRVDSRRSRSMARFFAVVVSHAPGFGGGPDCGHRDSASRNASWATSSASSMSPNRRTNAATTRPYSSRNTCSTVVSVEGDPRSAGSAREAGVDTRRVRRRPGRAGPRPCPGRRPSRAGPARWPRRGRRPRRPRTRLSAPWTRRRDRRW